MAGVGAASGITIGVTPAAASTRAASATKLSPRKRGSRPTSTRCGAGQCLHICGNSRHRQPDIGHGKLVGNNGPPSRGAKFDRCRHRLLHARQLRGPQSPYCNTGPGSARQHCAHQKQLGETAARRTDLGLQCLQHRFHPGGAYARNHVVRPHRHDHRRQPRGSHSPGPHARRGAVGRLRHAPSPCSLHLPLAGTRSSRRPKLCCLLKTASDQLPALEARLHELHSYQTPEFLVLAVEAGSHPYLAWLHACLRAPEESVA